VNCASVGAHSRHIASLTCPKIDPGLQRFGRCSPCVLIDKRERVCERVYSPSHSFVCWGSRSQMSKRPRSKESWPRIAVGVLIIACCVTILVFRALRQRLSVLLRGIFPAAALTRSANASGLGSTGTVVRLGLARSLAVIAAIALFSGAVTAYSSLQQRIPSQVDGAGVDAYSA
jgi:hypothetical protein